MSEITAIYTKWGWVNRKALYRLKEAHGNAVEKRLDFFNLDGTPFLTRFAGYLIEYLEGEGLVPEKTDLQLPIFEPAQGSA